MPESFVLRYFKREVDLYASGKGGSSDPGTLVFHTPCCAREAGSRATVTFHRCTRSDPFFHPLPTVELKLEESKGGSISTGGGAEPAHSSLSINAPGDVQYPSSVGLVEKERHGPDIANRLEISGPLYSAVRGKELTIGIGSYLIRICFGLEGHCFWMPTAMYKEIVSRGTVNRGAKSQAFVVPEEFSAGPKGGKAPLVSIQAAFIKPDMTLVFVDHNVMITFYIMALRRVCRKDDFTVGSSLWPYLWSPSHGPVYSLEPNDMMSTLERWKERTIKKRSMNSIFLEVKSEQDFFNGYGAQETCDMLIDAVIHPCMPIYYVCSDAAVWERFKNAVIGYQQGRVSLLDEKPFPHVSSDNPFIMNTDGHGRFMTKVYCYRRKQVRLVQSQLTAFHDLNLFHPRAVLQANGMGLVTNDLGFWSTIEDHVPKIPLARVRSNSNRIEVQNYILRIPLTKGTSDKECTVYTPILARPGEDWWSIKSIAPMEEDVAHVLDVSTLGPYSFNVFNQCAWTPSKTVDTPVGRWALVCLSKSRRKRPRAEDIAKVVKQPKPKRTKIQMSNDTKNAENMLPTEMNARITRSGRKIVR
ncbi:hypothetical protein CPC08DRAFT_769318 [Agrocybe pediades]|nr:hypothetical protein CPC08DRAFT_769318 [Agrocybe pediades]